MTYYPTVEEVVSVHARLIGNSQNHPFIDGNKRVAVTVTAAFLRVNGYRMEFDDSGAFAFLLGLYESGDLRFKALEKWLREHTSLDSSL